MLKLEERKKWWFKCVRLRKLLIKHANKLPIPLWISAHAPSSRGFVTNLIVKVSEIGKTSAGTATRTTETCFSRFCWCWSLFGGLVANRKEKGVCIRIHIEFAYVSRFVRHIPALVAVGLVLVVVA